MPDPAVHSADAFLPRLRAVGADVPAPWLRRLLERADGPPRWSLPPAGVSPISGKPTSAQAWALLVFHGLLSACGGRVASASGWALLLDLGEAVAPVAVRGPVARRRVSEEVQKALWARELLGRARWRTGEDAAALLLALESCGALSETPAMVEQARWRQGPGSQATDAQAIGALVAEVLWHCHEDAAALLREIAARTVREAR